MMDYGAPYSVSNDEDFNSNNNEGELDLIYSRAVCSIDKSTVSSYSMAPNAHTGFSANNEPYRISNLPQSPIVDHIFTSSLCSPDNIFSKSRKLMPILHNDNLSDYISPSHIKNIHRQIDQSSLSSTDISHSFNDGNRTPLEQFDSSKESIDKNQLVKKYSSHLENMSDGDTFTTSSSSCNVESFYFKNEIPKITVCHDANSNHNRNETVQKKDSIADTKRSPIVLFYWGFGSNKHKLNVKDNPVRRFSDSHVPFSSKDSDSAKTRSRSDTDCELSPNQIHQLNENSFSNINEQENKSSKQYKFKKIFQTRYQSSLENIDNKNIIEEVCDDDNEKHFSNMLPTLENIKYENVHISNMNRKCFYENPSSLLHESARVPLLSYESDFSEADTPGPDTPGNVFLNSPAMFSPVVSASQNRKNSTIFQFPPDFQYISDNSAPCFPAFTDNILSEMRPVSMRPEKHIRCSSDSSKYGCLSLNEKMNILHPENIINKGRKRLNSDVDMFNLAYNKLQPSSSNPISLLNSNNNAFSSPDLTLTHFSEAFSPKQSTSLSESMVNPLKNQSISPINIKPQHFSMGDSLPFKSISQIISASNNEINDQSKAPTTNEINNQHSCSVCGQNFQTSNHLANHMINHLTSENTHKTSSDNKIHECKICNRSFSRSDMLTRHMRLHTGIKPYECNLCNQVFSRSDHLHTHLRTHTGEKPYKCPQCSYAAPRRDMITRHLRIHMKSSPRRGRKYSTSSGSPDSHKSSMSSNESDDLSHSGNINRVPNEMWNSETIANVSSKNNENFDNQFSYASRHNWSFHLVSENSDSSSSQRGRNSSSTSGDSVDSPTPLTPKSWSFSSCFDEREETPDHRSANESSDIQLLMERYKLTSIQDKTAGQVVERDDT